MVKHFRISYDHYNGQYKFGERLFDGIDELVQFYSTYSIFTTHEGTPIMLATPLIPLMPPSRYGPG